MIINISKKDLVISGGVINFNYKDTYYKMKELIKHILREHTREIGEGKKVTTDDFINKAHKIHGDKYDYSKSEYISATDLITITCPIHGDFQLTPNKHLNGRGCQKCGLENRGMEQRKTNQEFIDQSNMTHDGKYDYSKVDYKTSKQKVIIICPIHGDFSQNPNKHVRGDGCPKCGDLIVPNRKSLTDFLNNSKIVHGDKYNYGKVDYKGANTNVIITCPKHGDFTQTPSKHINAEQGCPSCNESKGEKLINDLLLKNKINLVRQKRFLDCVNTLGKKKCLPLPFDFYLPNLNTCIEYDGEQHYKPVLTFGGIDEFKKLQGRDEMKNQYCKKNGIKLIRIPYTMKKEEIEPYILKELNLT
jgi:hypothetical protein